MKVNMSSPVLDFAGTVVKLDWATSEDKAARLGDLVLFSLLTDEEGQDAARKEKKYFLAKSVYNNKAFGEIKLNEEERKLVKDCAGQVLGTILYGHFLTLFKEWKDV